MSPIARNLYRIIGRAPASLIFRGADSLSVTYDRDGVPARMVFSTRYLDMGLSVPIPGDFQVVVESEADSIDDAATWVTAGRELASIISLATNAAISPLQGELIYEITPGKRERDFFQRFERPDQPTLSSRTVPKDEAIELMSSIGAHRDRDRLLRAVTQYTEALFRLAHGNELLVVAHLWMGIDAITPAYLRFHLRERGITREELGAEWGYDPARQMSLDQALEAAAKLHLTFQGDSLHYRIAKKVSDSFEHGFQNGGRLFEPARDVMVPTARYLREAVLRVAGLLERPRQFLLSAPYDRPRGLGGPELYLRARLEGESEQLSADGFEHPVLQWQNKIKEVALQAETWTYEFKPEHKFTVQVGKDIRLSNPTLEVWDGGIYMPKSAAQRAAEDQLGTKREDSEASEPDTED